ncbi:hypothetical protein M9Y10_005516 [Tritrichomonas musculus]|uniref:Uncharacterized protein n=1 Tax=Tritrichomonas musculus TaxID=1915356 RepID=A0ABR2JD84_9EUKA
MEERLLIRYGILVAAILELCIWLLTKKKSFIRENGRMPFIWNHDLNTTVKNYLNTDPSNQILIVSGPYQSGKSRVLELIAENLIRTKRFPFIIRADQAATIEDLIDLTKINCLKTIDELSNQLTPVEIQKYGTLSISSLHRSNKRDHPHFTGTASTSYSRITSIGLANMYHYMETVANSLSVADKDPDLFFDLINRIDLVIKPYVLFFGFNNLRKKKNKNGVDLGSILYNHSFERFMRRSQYAEFVPYIIEIKDSNLFLNKTNKLIFKSNQFVYAFTDQIENVIEEVSRKRSLFTQKEALYLQENFGGHGGSLSYVFHEMQVKRPIEESTETLNAKLKLQLSQIIKNTTDPVYYQICASKGSKKSGQVAEGEGEIKWHDIWPAGRKLLKPLIKTGLLYSNTSKIVKPAHPGVYRYICSIAKKPSWSFKTPPPKKKKDAPKHVREISVSNESYADENPIYSQSLNERLKTALNVTLNETDTNETTINKTPLKVNETDVNQTTLEVNETASNKTVAVNETVATNASNETTTVNETASNETTTVNETALNESEKVKVDEQNEKKGKTDSSLNNNKKQPKNKKGAKK